MKLYDIVDGSRRNAKPCARLTYDESTDTVKIDIADDANENDVPMLFDAFVARGEKKSTANGPSAGLPSGRSRQAGRT